MSRADDIQWELDNFETNYEGCKRCFGVPRDCICGEYKDYQDRLEKYKSDDYQKHEHMLHCGQVDYDTLTERIYDLEKEVKRLKEELDASAG